MNKTETCIQKNEPILKKNNLLKKLNLIEVAICIITLESANLSPAGCSFSSKGEKGTYPLNELFGKFSYVTNKEFIVRRKLELPLSGKNCSRRFDC